MLTETNLNIKTFQLVAKATFLISIEFYLMY